MPIKTSPTGSELFIVDNSDDDWKVLRYLHDWCQVAKSLDIATGYFEIGSLLALKDEWQKLDKIRILMGDEVSLRTRSAFEKGLSEIQSTLNASIEDEKQKNDFLAGVPAIVAAIRADKIECRVYRKDKFHAKAYITHARLEVVGASALVGSSNFTYPGLTENIELNVQITGAQVNVLREWYEEHWNKAEDVTPEILRTIERHTRDYTPFEVYAKSLDELLRGEPLSVDAWELAGPVNGSRVFPVLDKYQQDGYHQLLKIANKYRGAFLCDGVGLGKTFVGLMLIERLVKYERKNVCLLVPKSGKEPVWEATLARYLPDLGGAFGKRLRIITHTDITRGPSSDGNQETNYPLLMEQLKAETDVFLIDEAHNFRNTGTGGPLDGPAPANAIPSKGDTKPSRYWKLFDMLEGKQVFLLTATPVNNRLTDLQHQIELFTHRKSDYFAAAPLGIHSLPSHFREMEKRLLTHVAPGAPPSAPVQTNQAEAAKILAQDNLFESLVVQRSRTYVRKSQLQQNGTAAMFPVREDPKVVPYSLKGTYSKVLDLLEDAFNHHNPLFTLPFYYPLAYYTGPETEDRKWEEGRQAQVVTLIRTQFLKRFESSAHAFENSCQRLMLKILTWITKHSEKPREKHRLEKWRTEHEDILGYVHNHQHTLFPTEEDEEDEDIITDEMLDRVLPRDPKDYSVDAMLAECFKDLNQIVLFLEQLKKFTPKHDHKLQSLIKLLKTDPIMSKHKVLLFTEFKDTARYLQKQLVAAGIEGVDEVDSASDRNRGDILRQFAPYYNNSSSAELTAKNLSETRILIATDVLSEGLNLQDATRLINYDIHWNPVRLMQRIGRVDRRMNPATEARIIADHPDRAPLRGKVAYYNFLPPDELNDLLRLYQRVAHKTLFISHTFGIEGKKLLKPDDDYKALKDFNAEYEGETSAAETMRLEYERLLKDHPDLEARLRAMPGKIFSGKTHRTPGTRAVFLCYALPALDADASKAAGEPRWTTEAGDARWYLYDLAAGTTAESPADILPLIRSTPETPRVCIIPKETLADIRAKIEKQIKNGYLKQVQAPVGVNPALVAWMELN